MSLDDIITINISKQTTGITRAGFGYGLILGTHCRTLNRVDWYNKSDWSSAMAADGYETTDPIYLAVQAYFAQDPSPTKVAVGRIQSDQVTVSIDTVQNTTDYGIGVECLTPGTVTDHKYTSDADATQTEIANGLVALINAGAEASGVTASNVADDVKIVLDTAAPMVITLTWGATLMTVGQPAGTIEDADDALAAIALADQDWYGIAFVDRTQAQVELVAAWVESNEKLFITASDDTDIIDETVVADTTSIAAVVKAAAYARTAVMYNAEADTEYPDAAWLGKCLPKTPGAVNWAYKALAGATVDSLTATQRTNTWNKYASTYDTVAGVNITRYAKTGSGEYIDITRGIDALKADMQERIYWLLVNMDKIPYTDKGIGSVEAEVRAALESKIDDGVLAYINYVTSPKAADCAAADKAARVLKDVKFKATMAGAVNTVEITGIVTV